MIKGLLTKDAPSGIYHMGDDEALSTNELIEVICSADGNFDIKIHGGEQFIEQGYDEERGMKYYKLYYREER